MRRVVFLLPLLFAGCSCQPDPVADAGHAATAAPDTASAPPAADAPAAGEVAAIPVPELSAVAPGAVDETTTVHQYVVALLNTDRSVADAYWSGGRPAPHADDAVLRSIPDLRSLRVKTRLAVARDTEQPSRLIEVPVSVRAMTGDGPLTYEGWYRLQPRADKSGWEIQSASIHPVMK
ncbi:hypothetical protein [Stenotrophomonas bentonitica]|uniref:hypothetical protein n=1 Tax=Stenotrophomonas bentonitica TaxID=1450134 RepID=UPI00345EF67B